MLLPNTNQIRYRKYDWLLPATTATIARTLLLILLTLGLSTGITFAILRLSFNLHQLS